MIALHPVGERSRRDTADYFGRPPIFQAITNYSLFRHLDTWDLVCVFSAPFAHEHELIQET